MSPTVIKLVSAGLAIVALGVTAFVSDPDVRTSLFSIASGLIGWQFLPRAGDGPKSAHPDDMK
jgi:hypothetical protein